MLGCGLTFGPGRADDKAGLVMQAGIEDLLPDAGVAFLVIEFENASELVQRVEPGGALAIRKELDRRPITRMLLTPDDRKARSGEVAVILQNSQGITRLNRLVLAGIAGKNDAAITFLCQIEKPVHLADRNQTGLIQEDHTAGNRDLSNLVSEEALQRDGSNESGLGQVIHLAGVGRADKHVMSVGAQTAYDLSGGFLFSPVPTEPNMATTRSGAERIVSTTVPCSPERLRVPANPGASDGNFPTPALTKSIIA